MNQRSLFRSLALCTVSLVVFGLRNEAAGAEPGTEQAGQAARAEREGGPQHPVSLSPEESRAALRVAGEFEVDLVAAEPLVVSPVAIDFGPDGRLWVCEMYDYPEGIDGKPAGRIRVLKPRADGESQDGSTSPPRFDKATVFLDGIPFPTGVTVWRNGVLVCAAPDILYAEDTDGDDKADVVRKLFHGFGTHNFQARVNSLEYGLDGWVYGSCGLFGGRIESFNGKTYPLGDRDFRIRPDTGELEPATGRTQQGRARDDWGNWFACDNSTFARHYPLADHALRRNPQFAPAEVAAFVPDGDEANRIYPATGDLQMFLLSGPPGRATAACGLGVYRDDLLGEEHRGNLFTCEPVGLVVHRLELAPRGSTFAGRRAANEAGREFLSSTDTWFRPVQARTGPDGALYIVDMHRYVIEHPRWIPPEDAAKLDLRAGHDKGRIFRVRPKRKPTRAWPRLDRLDTPDLVAALDSPNGWQRDMAMQMLLWKNDAAAAAPLTQLAKSSPRPEARLQALCTLDGLGKLSADSVQAALSDEHPGVRRHAARLAERHLDSPDVAAAFLALVVDTDPQVLLQLAASLGEWSDPRAGRALAKVALRPGGDSFRTSAVLSSLKPSNIADVLAGVREATDDPPEPLMRQLLSAAAALGTPDDLLRVLAVITTPASDPNSKPAYAGWQWGALAGVLDALDRRGTPLDKSVEGAARDRVAAMLARARDIAGDAQRPERDRLAVLPLLGRLPNLRDADLELLAGLLSPQQSPALQSAAATALGRMPDDRAAVRLAGSWAGYAPALKAQVLDILLSRPAWRLELLRGIDAGTIPATAIDRTRRQQLLATKDENLHAIAAKVFAGSVSPNRKEILDAHRDVAAMTGDALRGRQVFAKTCSVCHRLEGTGYAIGPDLAALFNKSPQFLLQEILDPNRNVDSRWTNYIAQTTSGRVYNGLLAAETSTSITLQGQETRRDTLLRADIEELTGTGKSLMPEGFERDLTKQQLADLLAYLASTSGPPKSTPDKVAAAGPPDPKDARSLAKAILDESRPAAERERLARENTAQAAEIVAAMTADLPENAKEEYRRIPWIWRVSIAAGRKNDAGVMRKLLDVSLPKRGQPLRDWQAVVIGGGIINGWSLEKLWPGRRMIELLKGHDDLTRRWEQTLLQSAKMADDEKVPTGTRYDALRILALDGWEKRGPQLTRYLEKGVNDELQMGAVSGLSDIENGPVAEPLIGAFGHLSAGNRALAVEALLRTEPRAEALVAAIEKGTIPRGDLGEASLKAIREMRYETLRSRARKALP